MKLRTKYWDFARAQHEMYLRSEKIFEIKTEIDKLDKIYIELLDEKKQLFSKYPTLCLSRKGVK